MDHRYYKFLVLVEEGSYSKAAKRLRISQPAMTIAIASLEMGLGYKLFSQKKPHVVLSESGKIVHSAAKRIKKEIDDMTNNLNIVTQKLSMHVGIIDSIAHLLYSSPKNNILLKDIEAMVDNSKKIISDLIDNRIDFGLITGQNGSLPNSLAVTVLNDEEFVFVSKPGLYGNEKVFKIDNWLAFNRASTSYHHFTKTFKKQGIKVKPIFYSTSMDLLKEMAINGQGVALLPKHFVKSDISNGKLNQLNSESLYRPIWAITKNNSNTAKFNSLASYINGVLERK